MLEAAVEIETAVEMVMLGIEGKTEIATIGIDETVETVMVAEITETIEEKTIVTAETTGTVERIGTAERIGTVGMIETAGTIETATQGAVTAILAVIAMAIERADIDEMMTATGRTAGTGATQDTETVEGIEIAIEAGMTTPQTTGEQGGAKTASVVI